MNAASYVIFCALFFGSAIAAKLPSTFQKCKLSDKELEKCLIKAAEDGVRQLNFTSFEEIGLKKLEPLSFPKTTFFKENSSIADFDQKYFSLNFWGFSNVTFPQFKVDLEKKTANIDYLFPEIVADYEYDYDGHLFSKYVKGKGTGKTWYEQVCVKTVSTFEEVQKGDDKYFQAEGKEFSVSLKHIKIDLDNLFDGDQEKQDQINKLLNDKWNELYLDLKPQFDNLVKKIITTNFKTFLSNVPASALFDP